jgi:DNA-binding MarR family transcriptional regulator
VTAALNSTSTGAAAQPERTPASPSPSGQPSPSPHSVEAPSPQDCPYAGDFSALSDADLAYGADLTGALIAVMKRMGSLRARLAPTGDYDISQTHLLVRLAEQGPIRASDLAEMVCADPSTVSRQVAALVRSGLIERRADPGDGRASLLAATEAGRDAIAWHRRMRGAAVGPLIADWSEPDRETFLRLLHNLTRGLDVHRDAIVAMLMAHRPDRSQ